MRCKRGKRSEQVDIVEALENEQNQVHQGEPHHAEKRSAEKPGVDGVHGQVVIKRTPEDEHGCSRPVLLEGPAVGLEQILLFRPDDKGIVHDEHHADDGQYQDVFRNQAYADGPDEAEEIQGISDDGVGALGNEIFGSSHQSVPGLVQGIDFKFEELLVSEPVGLFLERFDFVVCALQRSC